MHRINLALERITAPVDREGDRTGWEVEKGSPPTTLGAYLFATAVR
jgi:hypothetical protein